MWLQHSRDRLIGGRVVIHVWYYCSEYCGFLLVNLRTGCVLEHSDVIYAE